MEIPPPHFCLNEEKLYKFWTFKQAFLSWQKTLTYNFYNRILAASICMIDLFCKSMAASICMIDLFCKSMAASICMIDLFCKSMAASNFWDERKSALIPIGYIKSWGQSVFSKEKLKIMGKVSEVEPCRNTVKNFVEVTCTQHWK